MTFNLGDLAQYGALGISLALFVWFYLRSLNTAEQREIAAQAEALRREQVLREDLRASRAECREETQRLVKRIQDLEDAKTKVLEAASEALSANSRAFERLIEHGSGGYRTRDK